MDARSIDAINTDCQSGQYEESKGGILSGGKEERKNAPAEVARLGENPTRPPHGGEEGIRLQVIQQRGLQRVAERKQELGSERKQELGSKRKQGLRLRGYRRGKRRR